jgi:hypothetical protein
MLLPGPSVCFLYNTITGILLLLLCCVVHLFNRRWKISVWLQVTDFMLVLLAFCDSELSSETYF